MGRNAPLISTSMWKMILGQSTMQMIVTFILHFAGTKLFFEHKPTSHQKEQINSLTFNTFVWLQICKLIVTRKLDEGDGLTTIKSRLTKANLNFFQDFFRNWYFIGILVMISVFQIVIMFVGGASFSVVRQTGAMWATAILCGVLAFPLGLIIRIVPDVWVERVFPTRLFNMLLKFMRFEPVVKNLKTLFKRAKRDPRSKKGKGKSSDDVESVGAVQVGSSGDIPM
ncbi:unnamed protein product, partial [Ambrosiozyma monospora]